MMCLFTDRATSVYVFNLTGEPMSYADVKLIILTPMYFFLGAAFPIREDEHVNIRIVSSNTHTHTHRKTHNETHLRLYL